jgi:uncharacterized protein
MILADLLLPTYAQMLASLDGYLAKASQDERGEALMEARLAQDMHPLATQLRFLCNMPGEALARIAARPFTSSEDDPQTLAEGRERIAATRKWLGNVDGSSFAEQEEPIELALPNGMVFDLTASEYVRDWALPQFYFHMNMAYAILRKEGLALGKVDYVPYMMRYLRGMAPAERPSG